MIRKLIQALTLGLLACVIYLPGQCEHPTPFSLGGTLQPFAFSPQYNPGEPEARQQLTIDERINGSSVAPAGGAGLGWTWQF